MAYAKIIQDGNTLIDLTQDTVNAESMLSGTTAHKNDGTVVTGTIQNQAAQTITPTTTDQTIASGKYLAGAQTIKGDANLVAANIAKDVTIFGVTGTHEGGGGGNPVADENDVIFVDYDGTIRYSYSAVEFANLTAMPDNPTHDGLTAQGWNWTLADAKAYVAANHILVIGQTYETDDGTTRIHIRIPYDNYSFTMYGSATWDINWGDGSTSSSGSPYSHIYTNAGYYVVVFTGTGSSCPYISNATQKLLIRKMEFGNKITNPNIDPGYYCCHTIVSSNKFNSGRFDQNYPWYGIQTLIIPSTQTSITYLNMTKDYALKYITFPKTSSFSINAFSTAYSLKRICVPDGTTSIPASCFNACYAMTIATIPNSVTSIGNNAFKNCNLLQEIYVMPETPPTLGSTVFSSNLRTIWVPSASLSTYQSASNWSSYSSKMKGV